MMRAGIIVAFALTASRIALAQAPAYAHARADQLFDDGRALMQKGDFDAACPKFEESQKLDPALGTLFNIGLCVEGMGKLQRALDIWRDALAQSQQANETKRAATAQQHIASLEARIPTVAITVDVAAPGLRVTVGGVDLPQSSWGRPLPLDPGNVDIAASAPDRQPYAQTLIVREKDRLTIEIPRLASTQVAPPGRSHTLAYGLGAGGAAAVVVGGVLALTARSKYEHAFSDGQCDRATLACDPAGQSTTDAARSRGNLATILGAVGLGAIAAGAVIYVVQRGDEHPTAALAPTIGPDGAGLALVGRF